MKIITTNAQIKRVEKLFTEFKGHLNDETLWTWIVVKILKDEMKNYKKNNDLSIIEYFFNKKINNSQTFNIGYEVQPISPRIGEGNTHLDLALGSIAKRRNTQSGIQFDNSENLSSVCFVESKMYSDLSTGTTFDKLRNQMTRVIENLLCFQDNNGNFPEDICFTLLSPRTFKLNPKSRLYGYKYFEFLQDLNSGCNLIEQEINQLNIPKRFVKKVWKYPVLSERLKKLRLNWVTYEEILEYKFDRTFNLVEDITDDDFIDIKKEGSRLVKHMKNIVSCCNDKEKQVC